MSSLSNDMYPYTYGHESTRLPDRQIELLKFKHRCNNSLDEEKSFRSLFVNNGNGDILHSIQLEGDYLIYSHSDSPVKDYVHKFDDIITPYHFNRIYLAANTFYTIIPNLKCIEYVSYQNYLLLDLILMDGTLYDEWIMTNLHSYTDKTTFISKKSNPECNDILMARILKSADVPKSDPNKVLTKVSTIHPHFNIGISDTTI